MERLSNLETEGKTIGFEPSANYVGNNLFYSRTGTLQLFSPFYYRGTDMLGQAFCPLLRGCPFFFSIKVMGAI